MPREKQTVDVHIRLDKQLYDRLNEYVAKQFGQSNVRWSIRSVVVRQAIHELLQKDGQVTQ